MFEKLYFEFLISQLNLQREEKLEGLGQGGGMRWMSSMTGGGNLYKTKESLSTQPIRIKPSCHGI
jgi:hypothetical protein